MKTRILLLSMMTLAAQAAAFAGAGGGAEAAPTSAMVASYWGYAAFLPLMIAAFVINGWLVRPGK
jgi:hypothetical protein